VSRARGDVAPGFAGRSLGVWRASQPPATALPATIAQRTHECGADAHMAGALRDLLG
jgi:hypothetical protein